MITIREVAWGLAALLAFAPEGLGAPNVEKLARGCERGRPADCERLASVARTDEDPQPRIDATRLLRDPSVLAEIVRSEWHPTVRRVAILNEHLDDQDLFAAIAKDDSDPLSTELRMAAVSRITDQAILAELARSGSVVPDDAIRRIAHELVPEAAAKRITDQAILAELARTGSEQVRKAAAANLTDPTLLETLVGDAEAPRDSVRSAVASLDVATLLELETSSELPTDAADAVSGRLRALMREGADPAVVARIATLAATPSLRTDAIRRLTDQQVLAEIAARETEWSYAQVALEKLTDPDGLRNVARTASLTRARLEALERLEDADADLRNAALVHAIEHRDWSLLARFAFMSFELSPESKKALRAIPHTEPAIVRALARAMSGGVNPTSWPRVRFDTHVSPGRLGAGGRVPPGNYAMPVTYNDGRMQSPWEAFVQADIRPGRCYFVLAGRSGSKWSPEIREEPCPDSSD